jgi:hypothetical protein
MSKAPVFLLAVAMLLLPLSAHADPVRKARLMIDKGKYREAITLLQGGETSPARSYQQARAMALLRRTSPCDAMLESVSEVLTSALKASRKLRKKARKDPAFKELHGTCMFLRLARGLDIGKPAHRRRLLARVSWHGTNWGTNGPGPTDEITLGKRRATLSAKKVRGNCPIKGTYSLQGGAVLLRGTCTKPGRKARPVQIKLMFNPKTCQLTLNGEILFSDMPDECNT